MCCDSQKLKWIQLLYKQCCQRSLTTTKTTNWRHHNGCKKLSNKKLKYHGLTYIYTKSIQRWTCWLVLQSNNSRGRHYELEQCQRIIWKWLWSEKTHCHLIGTVTRNNSKTNNNTSSQSDKRNRIYYSKKFKEETNHQK